MSTTTRTSSTEKRKQKILAAALESFTGLGFANTTMDDVCSKAGVSTGSIYHHFKSKDQLAAALYVAGLRDFNVGFFKELDQHHGAERGVRSIVHYYLEWVTRNPAWATYVLHNQQAEFLVHEQETLKELGESFVDQLSGWLMPFVERDEVQRLPRGLYVSILMGPLGDVVRKSLSGPGERDPHDFETSLADAAWNSLRVPRADYRPRKKARKAKPRTSLSTVPNYYVI